MITLQVANKRAVPMNLSVVTMTTTLSLQVIFLNMSFVSGNIYHIYSCDKLYKSSPAWQGIV